MKPVKTKNRIQRLILSFFWVILATAFVSKASSQALQMPEYLVKATFLYNFAKFTQWPDEAFEAPGSPLRICILGDGRFGDAFENIKGKTVGGRPLSIRFCRDFDESKGCHVLFIGYSEENHVSEILGKLEDRSCLTVGDAAGFVRSGGMLGFFLENNKVRFEANLSAIERSRLSISSRLLRLARIYRPEES